jgi:plasmid stability protein
MAQLLVRALEQDVVDRLKAKAKASGTSLEEFARKTLREVAKPSKEEAWAEIDRLRALTPARLTDSTALIREDRDNDEPYR